ncbi:MAG: hypothetical protein ACYSSI_08645 [Planctomycetota bacterium]|jgi:prepilin-type processing-associated H-X9-DG protein
MTQLNNQQKELLVDYSFGLALEEQIPEAESLLASNKDAKNLYLKLKANLSPLDTLEPETCPDELVESTINRLNNVARASQLHLEQLIAHEQGRKFATERRFWRNFGQILTAAAVILIMAGLFIPLLNNTRQSYWQKRCQAQLMRIGQAIQNYTSEHDGTMPSVATAAGAPWWKVGDRGKENQSNTRNIWLLTKNGYLKPSDFICPAKRQGTVVQINPAKAQQYDDFPSRKYVTYSFRIMCKQKGTSKGIGSRALMADMNPLFENLPNDYSGSLKIELDNKSANKNSSNHNNRGQNVLFCDGHVDFKKNRNIGIQADDIFTLKNTSLYKGYEVPSCETDAFLAP